jgi:2-succinyl-6-hydroxy-2,4-cyclohexadiene-1-carboxylate synthase
MPLVLHGFTEDDTAWAETCPLPGADYALLPGHGWRPCRQPGIRELATDLAAGLPLGGGDLVGYSMGGRIALRMALDHPERVRRLVLVSSGPGWRAGDERTRRTRLDEALAQILEEDGLGPFVAWWESNPVLKPARPFSADMTARLRARRLSHDPCGLAQALRAYGSGTMEGLWDRLGDIRVPTLLIAGEADARYRGVMGEMAQRMPAATLRVIPAAGHAIHREQPGPLGEAIRGWLAA